MRYLSVFFALFLIPGCGSAADPLQAKPFCGAGMTTVALTPIDSVLVNPGMGIESFNRVNGDAIDGEGFYPEASVAYYRWYWRDLEPEDGAINYSLIDDAMARAKAKGQALAFRVMAGEMEKTAIPAWLVPQVHGAWQTDDCFVPDFNDPVFLRYMERLVRALGTRYDGNASIDHIDIGSLGLWGEWHVTGTRDIPPIALAIGWTVLDWYHEAFPRTTQLVLVNNLGCLKRATELYGTGLRADCFGDMGDGTLRTWSHMLKGYPELLSNAGVDDVWKTAPVAFETCWDVSAWHDRGYDLDAILAWGLGKHCTFLNCKSSGIPDDWKGKFDQFLTRMGYRLVVTECCVSTTVSSGGSLQIRSRWSNTGVAPPYHAYQIGYRLRSAAGNVAWSGVSDANLLKWLPGSRMIGEEFTLPKSLPAGEYQLDIAVLAPSETTPVVRLAIAGRRSDGWYPITTVHVE